MMALLLTRNMEDGTFCTAAISHERGHKEDVESQTLEQLHEWRKQVVRLHRIVGKFIYEVFEQ